MKEVWASARDLPLPDIAELLVEQALRVRREDEAACRRMGRFGAPLMPDSGQVLTYTVAVLARENRVPFYVAAPLSTVDLSIATGDQIPIEQRDAREITHIKDQPLTPQGVAVHNPAFDVTPHAFIAAIITDAGVARPPYTESLSALSNSA